jgi:hypothetical protein
MKAGEGMGKYQGTRWPMEGTFSLIELHSRLAYEARSWTEGEEETTAIEHVNELTLSEDGGKTVVNLRITIDTIGSDARMTAFRMKWGTSSSLTSSRPTSRADAPTSDRDAAACHQPCTPPADPKPTPHNRRTRCRAPTETRPLPS